MLRAVARASGGTPNERLQAAVQEAVAAFSEARGAFDELERRHLPNDYTVLAERLHALGDALTEVHRLTRAWRQESDQPPG